MREITIKYDGVCAKCGNDLTIGQSAFYEKSMGVFCIGHEPKDTEEIRHYRTLRAERKASRLIRKAERLEAEAKVKSAPLESMRGDIAFFTQPGRIPFRDRIFRSYDKAAELSREANEARERADGIMKYKTIVAGDAERERQRQREEQDKIIGKGSRVYDICYSDEGIVTRVNKKTYTIQFDRGFIGVRDKTFVKAIK